VDGISLLPAINQIVAHAESGGPAPVRPSAAPLRWETQHAFGGNAPDAKGQSVCGGADVGNFSLVDDDDDDYFTFYNSVCLWEGWLGRNGFQCLHVLQLVRQYC
jgi:hypothetical protein